MFLIYANPSKSVIGLSIPPEIKNYQVVEIFLINDQLFITPLKIFVSRAMLYYIYIYIQYSRPKYLVQLHLMILKPTAYSA